MPSFKTDKVVRKIQNSQPIPTPRKVKQMMKSTSGIVEWSEKYSMWKGQQYCAAGNKIGGTVYNLNRDSVVKMLGDCPNVSVYAKTGKLQKVMNKT